MMNPWKKIENQNGLPLYINEITKERQWDHPKFSDVRQGLDDCNYVKYSSYRVALKFRVLQQSLWMDQVPLTVVAGVFERHKLGANECSLKLDCYDLEAILYDIFFACNKQNQATVDVDTSTELMMNFLLNVYDRDKTGKVQVLSIKLLLGLLSNSTLKDLYRYLFELCADHNNCITRLKLQVLLRNVTEIINFMHEDANFGHHLVNSSTESCFSNSPGLVGITEATFISWLEKGPSIISWLPILSRLKQAETVLHNITCSSCKMRPFVGLRYRCLRCTNYIQCQRCFFTGKTTNSHKLSHSMREYCVEANGERRNYLFMKKLFGVLTCSTKSENSDITITARSPRTENEVLCDNQQTETPIKIEPLASPLCQLQLVIRQLEQQNRELNAILSAGNHNAEDIKIYLENHRSQVSTQINKLKVLKEYLKLPSNSFPTQRPPIGNVQSTPMASNVNPRIQKIDMGILSPIAQIDENSYVSTANSGRGYDVRNEETGNVTFDVKHTVEEPSTMQYSLSDISTWIGGKPSKCQDLLNERPNACSNKKIHSDLDDALAKLQQILANNFTLDESLGGNYDNGQLKYAVSEVEGMLTSFIDTVETSRASSVQPSHGPLERRME